ncbi:MAG: hypothetical protein PHW73_05905 [Atribacterota bacterium]|nr:hypothetical protein [Atribacterota bacterium]
MPKIWGITYEILQPDIYPIWKLYLHNPFMWEGKYQVGINEKLILEAVKGGVNRFILKVGEREIMMNVPSEKGLKEKDKKLEFEDKKSLFSGSPSMRIYYFEI